MTGSILIDAERHVTKFLEEHLADKYIFHDQSHTRKVVTAVQELCGLTDELTDDQAFHLQLAAWFHDTGYIKGAEGHEARGADLAQAFMEEHEFGQQEIDEVRRYIMATQMPQDPQNLAEAILCDADLSHLGRRDYWDRCSRYRQELILTRDLLMDEEEWLEFELRFLEQHKFHTAAAKELFRKRKRRNIKQLHKRKALINPDYEVQLKAKKAEQKRKKKKKEERELVQNRSQENSRAINEIKLGRGVETMYRVTYRTHINLSNIADNKANIMLSINAIIISIIVSTLVPRIADQAHLAIPTGLLVMVCLGSMIFATLSTRPKVTEGVFSREDIEKKQSNLLFFGNFYNMHLDDFRWGMEEMIKDNEFLYSSMTRDLYFLGKVLAKKYAYLRLCYGIFMYGLIAAVAAFGIASVVAG